MQTILAEQAQAAKTDNTPEQTLPSCETEPVIAEIVTQPDRSQAGETIQFQARPFMLKFSGFGDESRQAEPAEAIHQIPIVSAPVDPLSERDPDSDRASKKAKSAGASG